jgi:YozE SAM-like fold
MTPDFESGGPLPLGVLCAAGAWYTLAQMAAFIPFYDWLTKHKSLRTPVGDVARVLLKDEKFPRDLTTLEGFLDYVRASANSSTEIIAKARVTWRAFEKGR